MNDGAAGRIRLAWVGSLAIHAVLVAVVAWWLLERLEPEVKSPEPTRLHLAMFQTPPSVDSPSSEPPPPVEEVSETTSPESPPLPIQEVPPEALSEPKVEESATEQPQLKPRPKSKPHSNPKPKSAPRPSKPVLPQPSTTPPELLSSSEAAPTQSVESVASAAPAPVEASVQAAPQLSAAQPTADPGLEDVYRMRIRQAVDENKHYPHMARRLREEGRVVVAFTIGADGRLIDVHLVKDSGRERLNEAALQAVRDAAPFPPFPESVQRERWDFTLPLSFALDR